MSLAKALFLLAVLPTAILAQAQAPAVDYEYYYEDDPSTPIQPSQIQGSFPVRAAPAAQAAVPQGAAPLRAAPAIPQGAFPARSFPAQSAVPQGAVPARAAPAQPQTTIPVKGRAPAAAAVAAPQQGSRQPEQPKPEPITILEQINEHNEDGSYTYGYEGSDGSFKLETRFPDGRVQGKYGYVDIESGKLIVIEYGADAMGFQPNGDLPEGIVVPPPVIGNDAPEEGSEQTFNDGKFIPSPQPTVHNRARQESGQRSLQGNPSQNRGQDFQQPPAPVPAPTRTPQLVVEQPFEEVRPAFQPQAPAQARPQPAQAFEAAPRPQPAQSFQAAPRPQQPQSFEAAPRPQAQAQPAPRPQQPQAFEASPRPQLQASPAPRPVQPAFEASSAQIQPTFTQEVHFEERPREPLNSFPATPAPARAQPAAPAPQQNFAQFQGQQQQQQQPQQQQQFASFPSNSAVRQGRFPSDSAEFPEVSRSSEQNDFQPSEQEQRPEAAEAPKPQFNPNRARGNVRQPLNSPAQAAPVRPRPQQEQQVQAQPAPVRARPQSEPQVPVRAPLRPQPEQAAQPVRQAPVTRHPLPGGHVPAQAQEPSDFRGSGQDSDGEQFHAPVESSGPPPKFESFPILGSQSQSRFEAAPSFQPASVQAAVREPEVESFRPEEEPQAVPVRIRPRPQEAQQQQQPQQNFQFQQPQQHPQQQQQQPQPQQQPQQNFQFQQQFQPQQSFQAEQPIQNFQFQSSQQKAPSTFDNLVQEFTVQNRAGRSEQDFQTQPVFKFNPVPAVPNL